MKQALYLTSRIREIGNEFIISKLKQNGYGELSPSHGDILVVLYKYKKLNMKEISEKIHRTKATLSVLTDKLEKLELVKREKSLDDTRNTYIVLTKKGKDLEPVFNEISKELNNLLYKNLSDEEADLLDSLLKKMLTAFT